MGGGCSGGIATLHLNIAWKSITGLAAFVKINSLLNPRYTVTAQLSATVLADSGNFVTQPQ